MADSQDKVTLKAQSSQADSSVVEAIATLKRFCEAMGVGLEFIKVSGPTGFKSVHGVDFRTDIYADEATLWRDGRVSDLAAPNSDDDPQPVESA